MSVFVSDCDMKNENCIFCRILAGEIPSRVLYEDEDFKVIMDVGPATRGHALILPKEHYANLYELPEELAAKAMKLAKKMTAAMTDVLHCDGFNLVQNNGMVAGQTVFHFHLHLIPRYEQDDNAGMISWKQNSFSDEEMQKLQELIVSGIRQ